MLLIGLLLLFSGGGGMLAFALAKRARERTRLRRVDAIADDHGRAGPESRLRVFGAGLGSVLGGLRSVFAFRMRRSWGISTNPAYLIAAGAAAAAALWLSSGIAPHLPAYVA